jgi:hypothetical protein
VLAWPSHNIAEATRSLLFCVLQYGYLVMCVFVADGCTSADSAPLLPAGQLRLGTEEAGENGASTKWQAW